MPNPFTLQISQCVTNKLILSPSSPRSLHLNTLYHHQTPPFISLKHPYLTISDTLVSLSAL